MRQELDTGRDREGTFAGTHGNDEEAPIPDLRAGRPRSRRDCLRDGWATPRETAVAVGADPV